MTFRTIVFWLLTHTLVGFIGFAAGIYALPILTAPEAPSKTSIESISQQVMFEAQFVKSLAGSDFLHWGEGDVVIGDKFITFMGALAPGPDYKLYLSPAFVETEAQFNQLKSEMLQVGDINTFDNFVVALDPSINPQQFNTVVVWCESFGEFITAAKYR